MSISRENNHKTSNHTANNQIANNQITNNHATYSGTNYWSSEKIAKYALFVALSMAVSFIEFPLIPDLSYLKYDPSGIVCLIAGFAYGPFAAAIVSVLGFAPHFFTNPFGAIMAILVSLGASVSAAIVYKKIRTKEGAIISLVIGSIVAIVLAIVGNLIITPLYAHISVEQVAALIVPALLPFNVIKLAIHCAITMLVYKPVSKLLKYNK
ncbi:ECF transporter S component [Gardnerella vaginalis]|uniref:ECF transporter S component n=1 Tax=Gardnerella vaginalis TaxID=2702 RepID=UPI00041A12FD|nr:ECF transporter S component [Gardnerella vaginalis]